MNKIHIWLVLIVALFASVIIAINIGTSDYETLSIYTVIGIVVYFFVNGWRNVWWLTAILIFSGVMFIHSFTFDASHLFVMMLVISSILFITSRGSMPITKELIKAGARGTAVMISILILYVVLHFFANWANPYSPTEFSLKSCSKAYFEVFASMFAFFWILVGPYGFTIKPTWPRTLLLIIAMMLLANVSLRGYMFLQGFQDVDSQANTSPGFFDYNVPIINMVAGVYTLRWLCPLACVIFMMVATIPNWWRHAAFGMRLLITSSIFLCYVGAVFSGGRATLPLCLLYTFMVAMLRGRRGVIMTMFSVCVFVFAFSNLFSDYINTKAPYYVSRSLQTVMIDKGKSYNTITGSQDVRNAARDQGFIEWKKDNRVFFFGRSVFNITAKEAMYNNNKFGMDGFVMNAIKSGRTHDMVSELLLQYGLFGLILYITTYVIVMIFFIRFYRVIPNEEGFCKALAGAMMLYLPPIFIMQILAGTYLPLVTSLVVGLIRAHLHSVRQNSVARAHQNLQIHQHPMRLTAGRTQ